MSDFPDGSSLHETIAGNCYRFSRGSGNATMLLELPNKVLLGVSVGIKNIEIFIPDENEIYHRAGDLTFNLDNNEMEVQLFSEALKEVKLDNDGAKISNTFSEITSVVATLNLNQKDQWWEKRLPNDTF